MGFDVVSATPLLLVWGHRGPVLFLPGLPAVCCVLWLPACRAEAVSGVLRNERGNAAAVQMDTLGGGGPGGLCCAPALPRRPRENVDGPRAVGPGLWVQPGW